MKKVFSGESQLPKVAFILCRSALANGHGEK
jgi:hypothetical protein